MSRKSRCAKAEKPACWSTTGVNKWSLAAGSQGIINPPALEETTHRLGELTALGWVARNVTDPEKNFGLSPDNLEITVELKDGDDVFHGIRHGAFVRAHRAGRRHARR